VTDGSPPADGPEGRRGADATPDDDRTSPTRRSVLQGLGATVAATGVSADCCGSGWSGIDGSRAATDSQEGVDPIPESYEIEVGGVVHEVPVHRKVARGTCADMAAFVANGGVLPPGETYEGGAAGFHYGNWTINGTPVWPMNGSNFALTEQVSSGTDGAVPQSILDVPIEHSLDFETSEVDVGEGETNEVLQVARTDISFGADVDVNVLDWHPSFEISDECRNFWCRTIDTIVTHERGHAEIDLEVAARLNDKVGPVPEPPENYGDVAFDAPEFPVEADLESQSRAEAERELVSTFQQVLFLYVKEAVTVYDDRQTDYHDRVGRSAAESGSCEASCQECEELEFPPIESIDEWRMDVDYSLSVQVSGEMEDGSGFTRLAQTYEASFDLTSPDGGSSEGPLSTIRGIASWLNGIDEFLDDLGDLVGIDVDVVPDDVAEGGDGGDDVLEGTGEVSVDHSREFYLESDDGGWVRTWTTATGTAAAGGPATLEFGPDAEEYGISMPAPETVQGRMLTTNSEGGRRDTPTDVVVPTPDMALLEDREGMPDVGGDRGDVPTGGNRSVGDVPDADRGAVGDPDRTFPVEDCRWILGNTVENDLWGEFPAARRATLGTEGDGAPDGREVLRWQIVPADAPEPEGHVYCPE